MQENKLARSPPIIPDQPIPYRMRLFGNHGDISPAVPAYFKLTRKSLSGRSSWQNQARIIDPFAFEQQEQPLCARREHAPTPRQK
ncbi:hypothetical protein CA13_12070 [Planctomycetes bacterium CA13]|uniref:Uncharacterized protein n=1 Tax=Novipirellula herctigrandis TaxID=2527986 RepID=A0A5C5YY15_9BACT|nr:hypothetical protein CA13_12070 [Planctomycetes bacterium CA13]